MPKCRIADRCISNDELHRVHSTDSTKLLHTVADILREKHPLETIQGSYGNELTVILRLAVWDCGL